MHMTTVYFVLPVGAAAVAGQFWVSRKALPAATGSTGLAAIAWSHGLLGQAAGELLATGPVPADALGVGGSLLLLTGQFMARRNARTLKACCAHKDKGAAGAQNVVR